MKKIKPILLSLLMLFMLMAAPSHAEAASNESVTYFDDGSYMVTTISVEPTLQNPSANQTNAAITSTTASKKSQYLNAAGEIMWYVKVTGSFTYTKDTAVCHSADITAKSLVSTWKLSKASAARSGATAYASATAKHYMAGVVTNTIEELVSLTCHPGGTFS